ncbi:MAG TPA: hypothetical protein VHI93_03315 [Candidatus Thermoplasmatota archaeon]|nr:hypothetical protein [Candidatus Thermoplasmatota archaeon]
MGQRRSARPMARRRKAKRAAGGPSRNKAAGRALDRGEDAFRDESQPVRR